MSVQMQPFCEGLRVLLENITENQGTQTGFAVNVWRTLHSIFYYVNLKETFVDTGAE